MENLEIHNAHIGKKRQCITINIQYIKQSPVINDLTYYLSDFIVTNVELRSQFLIAM